MFANDVNEWAWSERTGNTPMCASVVAMVLLHWGEIYIMPITYAWKELLLQSIYTAKFEFYCILNSINEISQNPRSVLNAQVLFVCLSFILLLGNRSNIFEKSFTYDYEIIKLHYKDFTSGFTDNCCQIIFSKQSLQLIIGRAIFGYNFFV